MADANPVNANPRPEPAPKKRHGKSRDLRVNTGDAAHVPMGAPCGWKNTEPVRKFYVIFEPTA
jgi:uncharacterized cupin superfamily protein